MGRLLAYTKTAGYRHDSIPAGVQAVGELGFDVDHTEGALRNLADYAAVVFLSTSGDVLDQADRDTLTGYLAGGGAWLGVHAASTTEYDWPWYGGLAGAWFDQHPEIQTATMTVEDRDHPATRHLGPTWTWRDEWYAFRTNPRTNPRPDVHVLLSVDETTYQGGTMGADHPIAWCREYGGGRSFYTALGHGAEMFAEPDLRQHLRGALDWLTGG
jgi:type 1 glutamine amidotransferase